MKNIITAVGNSILNEKIVSCSDFNVLCKDIQYKEGIIEFLEYYYDELQDKNKDNNNDNNIDNNEDKDSNKDSNIGSNEDNNKCDNYKCNNIDRLKIDYLIIKQSLDGEIEFDKLINYIKRKDKKIKIVVILEDINNKLENDLDYDNIYKVYNNTEFDLDNLVQDLNDKNINKVIEQKINQKIINNLDDIEKKRGEIIAITGNYGVGKSLLTCALCKYYLYKHKKVLILDFDIFNNSIEIMYNINQSINNNKNNNKNNDKNYNKNICIENKIIEISKYEFLLSGRCFKCTNSDCSNSDHINSNSNNNYCINIEFNNFINNNFNEKHETDYVNIIDLVNLDRKLKAFRKEYDYIIIDTTSNYNFISLKYLFEVSDKIVYIIAPFFSEIQKSLSLYEILITDFEVNPEKIKYFINKKNNYSLDEEFIKSLFNIEHIDESINFSEDIEFNLERKVRKNQIFKNLDKIAI